ncbi:MAG: MFS transporter [archaeon]|nr:MFS transporter [archaeon]
MEETKKKLKNIKTWPTFAVAFFRTFAMSIYSLAFQYYLVQKGIDPSLVGTIISALPIAYIFGPFLGSIITKKIGVRQAIILSGCVQFFTIGIQLIFFEPIVLLVARAIEGLAMGLFWPNLFYIISIWQKQLSREQSEKNLRYFNFSWNGGLILGFLAGLILQMLWKNYLLSLIIAYIIYWIALPFSLIVKTGENEANKEKNRDEKEQKDNFKLIMKSELIAFPILFSWIGVLMRASTMTFFNNAYPYIIPSELSELGLGYVMTFIQQSAVLLGITLISNKKPKIQRSAFLLSILFACLYSITIILNSFLLVFNQIILVTILFGTFGLFSGTMLGISQKITIDFNEKTNSSKYSTINEIIVGTGFGITPFITGYIIEYWDLYGVFICAIIMAIFTFIVSALLTRNFPEELNN